MVSMFQSHRAFSQDITGWKTKADVAATSMFGDAVAWLATFHNCAYDSTPCPYNTTSAVCNGTYPTMSPYPGYELRPHDGPPSAWERNECPGAPCDIPSIPANGKAGDCTGAMESGSQCQFACDDGFVHTKITSCFAGKLTLGTCVRGFYPPPPAPPSPLIQDTQDEDGADRLGIIIASAVSLLLIL